MSENGISGVPDEEANADPIEGSTGKACELSQKDFYEHGSKCCQQYSELTMKVRMVSQQVLVGYAVGIGLFLSRLEKWSIAEVGAVFVGTGTVLLAFATVLGILNYHHSGAFRAIRDLCLIPIERRCSGTGPWEAHKIERSGHAFLSWLAWYGPFLALALIGLMGLAVGIASLYIAINEGT